jgi:mannose-6-phosphate isomerase
MYTVRPALQPYAWGTLDDIPELLGMEPTGAPVAEAWWGDHPLAPATCVIDGAEVGLDQVVATDPVSALGPDLAEAYEGRLPYLLKVLAIGSPLSIQVHPSVSEAQAGFTREDEAGIPVDAPERTYRDRNHKPEMLVALTPMVVLAGFRPLGDVRRDVGRLDHPDAPQLAGLLGDDEDDGAAISRYVRRCLGMAEPQGLVAALARAASEPDASGSLRAAAAAAARFPADGGVLVALAMNRVDLEPGEACFTPEGLVHSYQSGVGLEIMANSDNVVRAGLTVKHIDVDGLLAVASTRPALPACPRSTTLDGAETFRPEADEFVLSLVRDGHATFGAGPRIVLAIEGETRVTVGDGDEQALARGEAVFVPFSDGDIAVASSGLTAVAGCPEPTRWT